MKIILLEDIKGLGKLGDVVVVKKGYARNFLFPRNLAAEADENSTRLLEDRKKRRDKELVEAMDQMRQLAQRIESISCTIPMAAGDDDKLYGSVGAEHIVDAMAAEGISLDRKQVNLPEHVKKLGVYQVEIRLHPEVTASTRIWVVRK